MQVLASYRSRRGEEQTECPFRRDGNARPGASVRKCLLHKPTRLHPALPAVSTGFTCTVRHFGIGDMAWRWSQKSHNYTRD